MKSKFETKAQAELQAEGWLVDYKIRPSGFKNPRGYAVDYFNLFDLIAWKPGIVRWIAIKGTMGVPSQLRRDIEAFEMGDNNVKEIWYYRKLAGNKTKFVVKKEIINPASIPTQRKEKIDNC